MNDFFLHAGTNLFWTFFSMRGKKPPKLLQDYILQVKEKCRTVYSVEANTFALNVSGNL